jgi:membrane-associated protease RseP (regulator of RpoE activity)
LFSACTNLEKQQVTLKKNSKGLGIHLSVGPPPVSITLVEPSTSFITHSLIDFYIIIDSEAMAAGIKVGDVIQEVNGKDCQSMAALELSDLMELKSLIQHIPDTDSIRCVDDLLIICFIRSKSAKNNKASQN